MFPTTFLCCLVCVLLASMSAATAERTSNVMRVADTADSIANRLQFSATTTAAPQHRDADEATDDDTAQSETIDDFEDTIPDGVPADSALSGFESAAAGLGKVVDVFETLSTVWQTVNAQRANVSTLAPATGASEARYIKGDPLKGYYDFIITEGSYKFWAVFQLLTAALMIYSTFAAIYYSKVNPIVSDYDYVSYLGGRSLGAASAARSDADGAHPLDSLLNAGWMRSAAHGFEWVLEAVERIPA